MYLHKQPSGQWRVIVQHRGRKASGTGPTKAAAQQVGATLLLELGAVPKAQSGTPLGALLNEHLRVKEMTPAARYDFRLIVTKLPTWITDAAVDQVEPFTVQRWYQRLPAEGWTDHRIRKLHTLLRSAYVHAVLWRWCPTNPLIDVKPPSVSEPELHPPDADLTGLLLRAADTYYGLHEPATPPSAFGVYIRVAANSGARRGEVCALRWGDVDLDTRILAVRRSVSFVAGQSGPTISATKTGTKGHRGLRIGEATAVALRHHLERSQTIAAERDVPHGPTAWMFTHDGRTPWRPDYVSRVWHDVRQTVKGAEGMKLHLLRHAVATRLIAAGTDPRTVAGRLGHANPHMTLKTYAAFLPAQDSDAADLLEEGL